MRTLISPQQIPRKWLVTIFTRFRDRMDFYGGARRWSCGVQAWNIGREPIRRALLWNILGRMLWKSVVLNELGLYIYVLPRERADLSPFLFPAVPLPASSIAHPPRARRFGQARGVHAHTRSSCRNSECLKAGVFCAGPSRIIHNNAV